MKITKKFIIDTMKKYWGNMGTDKYGQAIKHNLAPYAIFGENTSAVLKFNEEHRLFTVTTYGWAYGEYDAIERILDNKLKQACEKAFRENEKRLANLNSW